MPPVWGSTAVALALAVAAVVGVAAFLVGDAVGLAAWGVQGLNRMTIERANTNAMNHLFMLMPPLYLMMCPCFPLHFSIDLVTGWHLPEYRVMICRLDLTLKSCISNMSYLAYKTTWLRLAMIRRPSKPSSTIWDLGPSDQNSLQGLMRRRPVNMRGWHLPQRRPLKCRLRWSGLPSEAYITS